MDGVPVSIKIALKSFTERFSHRSVFLFSVMEYLRGYNVST
jgi:hypothetical protein